MLPIFALKNVWKTLWKTRCKSVEKQNADRRRGKNTSKLTVYSRFFHTFTTRKSYKIGWKTTFQRLLITLINC